MDAFKTQFLGAIYWNPNPDILTLPFVNHALKWYGLLFMAGFFLGSLILLPILREKLSDSHKHAAYSYLDGLVWWIVIGTIVGARLGHVFLYDWPSYQDNWIDILKVWEGGLASHGGTIGILLAAFLYSRKKQKEFPEIKFLDLCDLLTIPAALTAAFIRIGNFINQEIIGTPSTLPWAVVFGKPADGSLPIPRHPVQLYESAIYFATFLLLLALWKYSKRARSTGFMLGFLFISIFGARFFLEFFKAEQGSSLFGQTYLQAGQLLSLPFFILGVILVKFSYQTRVLDKSISRA